MKKSCVFYFVNIKIYQKFQNQNNFSTSLFLEHNKITTSLMTPTHDLYNKTYRNFLLPPPMPLFSQLHIIDIISSHSILNHSYHSCLVVRNKSHFWYQTSFPALIFPSYLYFYDHATSSLRLDSCNVLRFGERFHKALICFIAT